MKVRKLRLERFRQFRDTQIELGDFNLLVGPNNCGKTSILHAIRAFFALMKGHVRFEGAPPVAHYHRRFLSSADEIAPTPDIWELWYRRQAGQPAKISVTFEDETSFTVVLRQQFGQIHVSAENLPQGLTADQASACLETPVVFIPGLVGVLVVEPFATPARRNSLASQGRYAEIFRSGLQQLHSASPELVQKINESLDSLFGVTVTQVEFNPESDEFVTVKYTQNATSYDVVSSGAGLQQVIQLLTYLYLAKPRILLIDEPDAHLHSKLQSRVGKLFRAVADDLNAQVFLSTHSLDLIDTFTTNEVVIVDSSKPVLGPIGQNANLVSALVEAGIVDVSALSRVLASRRIVVVEDKDQTILKAFDKAMGSPLFSPMGDSYVLPARGVGNFRAISELGNVLQQLLGAEFEIVFLQDRDGAPDWLIEPYLESIQGDGRTIVPLGRHEIESYLLENSLISKAAERCGRQLAGEVIVAALLEGAQQLKAKARRTSLETARALNRFVPPDKKHSDADLEERVYEWFDGLDFADTEVVRAVIPGKELLKLVLAKLNEGAEQQISRGHLVACVSEEDIPPDLQALLGDLAGDAA